MTDASVIEAAGRLTTAQRAALRAMPRTLAEHIYWGRKKGQKWLDSAGWQLVNAGLVDYSGRGPKGAMIFGLTPLGLAVRAHLAIQGPA